MLVVFSVPAAGRIPQWIYPTEDSQICDKVLLQSVGVEDTCQGLELVTVVDGNSLPAYLVLGPHPQTLFFTGDGFHTHTLSLELVNRTSHGAHLLSALTIP